MFITLAADFGWALGGSEVVGGFDGVSSGVSGLNLFDGDLVGAVGAGVTVHAHATILLQGSAVLQAGKDQEKISFFAKNFAVKASKQLDSF